MSFDAVRRRYNLDPNESAIIRDNRDGSYGILEFPDGWPTDINPGFSVVWTGPSQDAPAAWGRYVPTSTQGGGYVPIQPGSTFIDPFSNTVGSSPIAVPTPTPNPIVVVNPGGGVTTITGSTPIGGGGFLMVSEAVPVVEELAPAAKNMGPAFWKVVQGLLGGATSMTSGSWGKLPTWAKQVLGTVGLTEGTQFIFGHLLGVNGTSSGGATSTGVAPVVGQTLGTNMVVKTWQAGSTSMGMLADGREFAMRKNGTMKIWRPRKPTAVIYSNGVAGDVRKMLAADRVLNRQSKGVDAMIKRRAKKTNGTTRKKK